MYSFGTLWPEWNARMPKTIALSTFCMALKCRSGGTCRSRGFPRDLAFASATNSAVMWPGQSQIWEWQSTIIRYLFGRLRVEETYSCAKFEKSHPYCQRKYSG